MDRCIKVRQDIFCKQVYVKICLILNPDFICHHLLLSFLITRLLAMCLCMCACVIYVYIYMYIYIYFIYIFERKRDKEREREREREFTSIF